MSVSSLTAEQLAQQLFSELALSKAAHFFLALSGGCDSCVLLDLMAQVSKQHHLSLSLLHFDHGLQASSGAWAEHCQGLATHYDLPLLTGHQTVTINPQQGVESSARAARYAWFSETISAAMAVDDCSSKVPVLLTAHHANDQAETLLLNLIRGTGVRGLRGIARKKKHSVYTLVRPLLDVTRQQIDDYAAEQSLSWVDDPSNQSRQFRRNAIRLSVMPALQSVKQDAVQQLGKFADHMVATDRLLTELASADLQTIPQHAYCPLDQSFGIDLQAIKALGERSSFERQANLLRHWLSTCGYALNSQQDMQQLLDWANHGAGEKSELRNGHRVYRVYRQSLYVMPYTVTVKHDITLQWDNLLEPLILHGGAYSLQCLDCVKAQQLGTVNVIFADQARQQFSMKKRFQASGVPHWRRQQTPILVKDDAIVAIAGDSRVNWLAVKTA